MSGYRSEASSRSAVKTELTSAHLECALISVTGSSNRYLLTAAVAVAEVSISLGGDMLPAMTSSSWRTSPADDGRDDDDQTTYQFGQLTDLSLPKIGQQFGGRDHTTVINADRKIRSLVDKHRSIYTQVTELINHIKQQARSG